MQPGDEARQFYRLTPGKKMIVMLGGPCMNLFIYLVLTTILLLTLGTPQSDATTKVSQVSKCLLPVTATPGAGQGLQADQHSGCARRPQGGRQDRGGQRHADHSRGIS